MGSSLILKGGTSTPKSIVETFSASHSFVVGDVVRYDTATSQWKKAQADTAENSEVAGVISAAATGTFDVTYSGYISVPSLSGLNFPVLFLDSAVAGGVTSSPPSAIGSVIKPVLTKTTSGTGYVVVNYLGTQIGGSSTVAIDEIQPVGTIMPFAGSTIPDSWLACDGASYAIGTYPQLYAKLQYSSGDRAPAYGYVANITVGNSTSYATGQSVSQTATGLSGTVLALSTAAAASGTNTLTVQVIPTYSSATKNFVQPNAIFSNAAVTIGSVSSTISAVSVTHFNTPDLRGRFALGVNTSTLPPTGDLESDSTNNSAISGIYSLGSEGGQESTIASTGVTFGNNTGISSYVTSATTSGGLISNMPPYTVVRYIIKATPYTRAAIIDGLDLPYNNLLVGDLRDGALRPGGSGEDLVFKTNNGVGGTERMRLTNSGSLGIGTGSPQSSIHVSSSAPVIRLQDTDDSGNYAQINANSSGSQAGALFLEADKGGSSSSTAYVVANVGNTERLRIDSSRITATHSSGNHGAANRGNLVVGNGIVAGNKQLQLGVSDTNNCAWIEGWLNNTGGLTLSIQPSGGNVGIGTTLPASALHIYKNTVESTAGGLTGSLVKAGMVIETPLNGTGNPAYGPGLFWKSATQPLPLAGMFVGGRGQGTCLNFATSTSYAQGINKIGMTITDGKVGVGTTGPTVALDVVGAIKATDFANSNVSSKPGGSTLTASDPTSESANPNPAIGQPFRIDVQISTDTAIIGRTGQTWMCIAKCGNDGAGYVRGMAIRVITAPTAASNWSSDMGLGTAENLNIIGWRIA